MAPEDRPTLRPDLEVTPATVGGQHVLVVRDRLGLIDRPVVLRSTEAQMLRLFDGNHSVRDIEVAMVRQRGGLLLVHNEAEKLVSELDAHLLLDTHRFRQARARLFREFADQQVRESAMAGVSCPADPDELRRCLDAIVTDHGQPPVGNLLAVVAPHIDLQAGRESYAAAYRAVAGRRPDLVLVLGTGHSMGAEAFCLTTKDFRTPFGTVETDKPTVEKIRAVGGPAIAPDDFPHRREHSIEFQVVFLQHVFKGHAFRIMPVLCGSFGPFLAEYNRPADVPGVRDVLGAMRSVLRSSGEDVLVVAGVDLSHVGPKFGDDRPAAAIVGESRAHDQALLESLCRNDVTAFWAESRRVEDRFHVCGFSALACLLEILPPCRGTVLSYETRHEEATRSAVSFAAVVLESGPAAVTSRRISGRLPGSGWRWR